jgi:hypothetical protein
MKSIGFGMFTVNGLKCTIAAVKIPNDFVQKQERYIKKKNACSC